jgi:hypothetical protein
VSCKLQKNRLLDFLAVVSPVTLVKDHEIDWSQQVTGKEVAYHQISSELMLILHQQLALRPYCMIETILYDLGRPY